MSDKEHAKYGSPSGLAALEQCQGKIAFCGDEPRTSSEYSIEGDGFHDAMEIAGPLYLSGDDRKRITRSITKFTCNYPEMEQDVFDACEGLNYRWCEFVKGKRNPQAFFEAKVKLNALAFGTSDVIFTGYNPETKRTDVATTDWKYGKGKGVTAEGNLQGIAYLIYALRTFKIKDPGLLTVTIAQVRTNPSWATDPAASFTFEGDEVQMYEHRILNIIDAAKELDEAEEWEGYLHAGEHCFFCPGKHKCPEQKKKLYDSITATMEELPVVIKGKRSSKRELSLEERAQALTLDQQVAIFLKKSQIEDFLNAVAENVAASLSLGAKHDDVKLIRTGGRRKWKSKLKEEVLVTRLKELGVKKPWKAKEVVGIGEAERQLPKTPVLRKKFAKLTEVSAGGTQVVASGDKREGIDFIGLEDLDED